MCEIRSTVHIVGERAGMKGNEGRGGRGEEGEGEGRTEGSHTDCLLRG